jgi:hypothetical protein
VGCPYTIHLYSMEASSGLLQRILQVFAVLQWIFILALGEFPKPGDLGKPSTGALLPHYLEKSCVGISRS